MEKHNISLKVEDLSQETKTCMMRGIGPPPIQVGHLYMQPRTRPIQH
jgi:hypothetical protein